MLIPPPPPLFLSGPMLQLFHKYAAGITFSPMHRLAYPENVESFLSPYLENSRFLCEKVIPGMQVTGLLMSLCARVAPTLTTATSLA